MWSLGCMWKQGHEGDRPGLELKQVGVYQHISKCMTWKLGLCFTLNVQQCFMKFFFYVGTFYNRVLF